MKFGTFTSLAVALGVATALSSSLIAVEEKNKDYRTIYQDGRVDYGKIGDSYKADLVLYLAGNQFMVMEELIKDFLAKHGDVNNVHVETIPAGPDPQGTASQARPDKRSRHGHEPGRLRQRQSRTSQETQIIGHDGWL